MPAGVAVPIVKMAMVVAENAADVLEVAVLEQARRRHEQVGQQGDGGEHGEPAAVELRGGDVGALESLRLRQPAGDVHGDDAARRARRGTRAATSWRRCRRAAAPSRPRRRPSPLAIASTLTAYARLLRGISSAATTATRKSSASPSGRPIACVATRNGNVGANAPIAVTTGAATAIAVTTRRRPIRSASTATGRTRTIPARTTEPATPTPVSLTPKSSAAKLTVWVNSVLTNADDIDAAASRPSTVSARGSRRSGGAHHGVGAAMAWMSW